MSSAQYRVRVVELGETWADFQFRLVGDHITVFAETSFLARVLAESMPDDHVAFLWPGTEPEFSSTTAWDWMSDHADEVIVESSIVLHDEVDYPAAHPGASQLAAQYRAEYTARWRHNHGLVITSILERIETLGQKGEYADEREMYEAATLEDLIEELVNAQFEALAQLQPRASLRFCVSDPRWLKHLAVDGQFEALAWPL